MATPTNLKIKSTERVALVGMTGGGKSYLAGKLLSTQPRLVVCDPKGDVKAFAGWNLIPWEKGKRALEHNQPARVRIPDQFDNDAWDAVFAWCFKLRNVVIYIDELYLVTNPLGTRNLRALYTSGRSLGIGTWGCTQRPVAVPGFCLSEAEWKIQFYLDHPNDRKRMAEWGMGEAALMDLPEYWYLLRKVRMREPLICPPYPAPPQVLQRAG